MSGVDLVTVAFLDVVRIMSSCASLRVNVQDVFLVMKAVLPNEVIVVAFTPTFGFVRILSRPYYFTAAIRFQGQGSSQLVAGPEPVGMCSTRGRVCFGVVSMHHFGFNVGAY